MRIEAVIALAILLIVTSTQIAQAKQKQEQQDKCFSEYKERCNEPYKPVSDASGGGGGGGAGAIGYAIATAAAIIDATSDGNDSGTDSNSIPGEQNPPPDNNSNPKPGLDISMPDSLQPPNAPEDPVPIPTPALLPGLIAMAIGVVRKRKQRG